MAPSTSLVLYKKPSKKRTYKKKSRKMTIPRNILKQNSTRVKMKYCDTFEITQLVADLATNYVYKYTDINDPQYAVGGHQPWGHDTFATLFRHYTVIGCTIKVTASVLGAASRITAFAVTNNSDAAITNLATYSELAENPNTTMKLVNGYEHPTIKKTYNKQKVFRNSKNAELTAPMNGTPDEQYYALISVINVAPAVLSATVQFTVELEYDVLLTENKALVQS